MYHALLVLSVAFLMVVLGFLYLLVRNQEVSNYRKGLLDAISKASAEDIRKNRGWRWRWDVYRSVAYDRMVFKFWIRLDDFYPDKSFIDPDAARPAPSYYAAGVQMRKDMADK